MKQTAKCKSQPLKMVPLLIFIILFLYGIPFAQTPVTGSQTAASSTQAPVPVSPNQPLASSPQSAEINVPNMFWITFTIVTIFFAFFVLFIEHGDLFREQFMMARLIPVHASGHSFFQ